MIKKILVFVIAFCWLITKDHAQDSLLTLSLQQAKDFAIEHNLLIKNAKLNVAISDKKVWEAIAVGLPQADFSMDYTDFFDYEIPFEFGMGDSPDPYVPDITLMDAGDFEILQLLESLFNQPSEPVTILMDNSASAKFQVSQLIFNGQYWIGMQTAKLAKKNDRAKPC